MQYSKLSWFSQIFGSVKAITAEQLPIKSASRFQPISRLFAEESPRRKSHARMTTDTPSLPSVPLAPPEEGDANQILKALATAKRVKQRSRTVRIRTV